jgi:hypothetical protein
MKARSVVAVLVVAFGVYVLLAGERAWWLLTSGDVAGVIAGLAVLAMPAVGVWVIAAELRFGAVTQRMGEALAREGGLPADLPRTASGRVERDAAQAEFEQRAAQAQESPQDWRCWFRLGLAYDAARDRRRARAAMRRAAGLFRDEPTIAAAPVEPAADHHAG